MQKLIFILLFAFSILCAQKIDLNTASLNDLKKLPLTEKQAKAIYNYRNYTAFFENVYDLKKIPEIDQKTLLKLKPVVYVSFYSDLDDSAKRREEVYYLLERLGSNEGASEGFSDVWEDFLMTPRNINTMSYSEILSFPSVSPVDAAIVMNRIAKNDTILGERDLRKTPGLSYFGYRNLKSYVTFEDAKKTKAVRGDYQFKYVDIPFEDDAIDMYKINMNTNGKHQKDLTYWGYWGLDKTQSQFSNKLRLRIYDNYKAGFLQYTEKGGKAPFDDGFDFKDGKFYIGYEGSSNILENDYLKIYGGNFSATFGQGLVMESVDFYSSRKTGFGFSKRITGIVPDLSSSQEFNLKGAAVEWRNQWLNATAFISNDKKDAVVYLDNDGNIVQEDGKNKVFSYITSTIRKDNDELIEAENYFNEERSSNIKLAPRKDIIDETVWGGHLEVSPYAGSYLGFSTYTALYDNAHFVAPKYNEIADTFIYDNGEHDKIKAMDNEISAMYSTKTDKYSRDYRRVIGFDFGTVINNTSIQGEYAELSVDGEDFKIGDDPKAMLFTAYTQFDNLYLLSLYRDYDLDFDNPYSRGFSEHQKLDDSIFDKNPHITENALLADLYANNAQAQAEKGIYFEARYRFSRYLTLNRSYVDIWERKCDNRKSFRLQSELEFRPLHQVALRAKHKFQKNRFDDDLDRATSTTNETTLMARYYLSNRDKFQIEYRYNTVKSPPYIHLTNPATPNTDDLAQGQTLIHGDYIGFDYTHNFNDDLKMNGSFIFWNGHGISHWDWEDMEIDFMGEQGTKYWISFNNRIANNLFLTLKYKIKHYRTKELYLRKWWNDELNTDEEEARQDYFQTVENTVHGLRLQLDWKF